MQCVDPAVLGRAHTLNGGYVGTVHLAGAMANGDAPRTKYVPLDERVFLIIVSIR